MIFNGEALTWEKVAYMLLFRCAVVCGPPIHAPAKWRQIQNDTLWMYWWCPLLLIITSHGIFGVVLTYPCLNTNLLNRNFCEIHWALNNYVVTGQFSCSVIFPLSLNQRLFETWMSHFAKLHWIYTKTLLDFYDIVVTDLCFNFNTYKHRCTHWHIL